MDLERDIQKTTEENLELIFGLKLIRHEFSIRNMRIDTLAYDPQSNAFVVIEYKRDRSSSVVDQGFAYRNLLLDNKAEAVLEYNQSMGQNAKTSDFNWDQTKVIILAESFTAYQTRAVSKNLPIELWEVKVFDENVVIYHEVEHTQSEKNEIKSIAKGGIRSVVKESKVYTEEDHLPKNWQNTRKLYEDLKSAFLELVPGAKVKPLKQYISFIEPNSGKSYADIVTYKKGIKVYLKPKMTQLKSSVLKLEDCRNIGHWGSGDTCFWVTSNEDVPHAVKVVKQALNILSKQ